MKKLNIDRGTEAYRGTDDDAKMSENPDKSKDVAVDNHGQSKGQDNLAIDDDGDSDNENDYHVRNTYLWSSLLKFLRGIKSILYVNIFFILIKLNMFCSIKS